MPSSSRPAPRSGSLLVLVLAACGHSAPSAPPPDPHLIGTGGGVVTGPGGAVLGIPPGILTSPISVVVATEPAPALPLPGGLPARGEAYRVTPSRGIAVAGLREGLVVGLPVPAAADPTRLRVVALSGPGEETSGPDWSFPPSFHDAARGLVVARLLSLDPAGTVVRLVEDAGAAATSGPAAALARAASAQDPVAFRVEPIEPRPPDAAGAQAFYEAQLNLALARLAGAGFLPPLVETVPSGASANPPAVQTPPTLLFRATVQAFRPSAQPGVLTQVCEFSGDLRTGGEYRPDTKELALCAYGTAAEMQAHASELVATTFHELFHAVQASYLGHPPAEQAKYFKEATGVMAGAWGPRATDEAVRDPTREPRLVDEPLTRIEAPAPYSAQDFWVDVAGAHQLGFPALTRAFLERGHVDPAEVDATLAGTTFASSLATEYRRFVRAQSAVPSLLCLGTAGHLENLGTVGVAPPGVTGIPALEPLVVGTLSTKGLQLQVQNGSERPFHLDVFLDGDWAVPEADGGNRIVVVEAQLDPSLNVTCSTTADGPFAAVGGTSSYRVTVPPAWTTYVHVLGVNGHHDRPLAGHVTFAKERFTLDSIVGPSSIPFDQTSVYQLNWSGAPTLPITVRTRVTACSLSQCTTVPALTLPSLASPQPFPLFCDSLGSDTPSPGSFTIEATLTDASGEQTNPISVTVGCVN